MPSGFPFTLTTGLKHTDSFKKIDSRYRSYFFFSLITEDQAHGQNNACIKGDGWVVGLVDVVYFWAGNGEIYRETSTLKPTLYKRN